MSRITAKQTQADLTKWILMGPERFPHCPHVMQIAKEYSINPDPIDGPLCAEHSREGDSLIEYHVKDGRAVVGLEEWISNLSQRTKYIIIPGTYFCYRGGCYSMLCKSCHQGLGRRYCLKHLP